MTIVETRAATEMEQRIDSLTPHEVINLLMDGALERIEQAQQTLANGDVETAGLLMSKLVGIINGLRGSLDFDQGGEVAFNLDRLYGYMIHRLTAAEEHTGEAVLTETGQLLGEVKEGWSGIAA